MLTTKHLWQLLLLTIAAPAIALMSASFMAGDGEAAWWFYGPMAVAICVGLLLAKERANDNRSVTLYRYGKNVTLVLSICCTMWAGWLVLRHEPLLRLNLGSSALVTTLFSLVAICLVLYYSRLPLLSFPSLFLGTTFIFTCSPLITYQLEGYEAFRWWKLLDLERVRSAMPIVILAFSSFLVGSLLFARVDPIERANSDDVRHIAHARSTTLRWIGLALYTLSIVIMIFFTLRGSGLSYAIESGYRGFAGARKDGALPRLVVATMSWFLPWSVLIITATSKNRQQYALALFLAIPACVMMFMAGDRTAPLAVIMLVPSAGHILGFPMDWKRSIAVIALVALLTPTIVNLRSTPIKEWSLPVLIKAMTNQVEDKREEGQPFLAATLMSTGTSLQTLMGTIMFVPETEPYQFGLNYLRAPIAAIPYAHPLLSFFGVDLDAGEPSDWLKSRINPDGWAGQGYLQLAEAYLQFGAFGVIGLYFLLGVVLPKLWWSLQTEKLDSRKLALALLVMMAVLTWVRNEATGVVRPILWGSILIYVLPAILEQHRLEPRLERRLEQRQERHALKAGRQ
jgi:hypothetical protein